MNYLHSEFNLEPSDVVEVEINKAANVQLMDYTNFQNYKNGRRYKYYGGYFRESPVRISVPHSGHWHLVVDLGGAGGVLRASSSVIRMG